MLTSCLTVAQCQNQEIDVGTSHTVSLVIHALMYVYACMCMHVCVYVCSSVQVYHVCSLV